MDYVKTERVKTMNRTKLAAGVLLVGGLAVVLVFRTSTPTAEPGVTEVADIADAGTAIHVYKTATCGCCGLWVEHMEAAGFEVTVEDLSNPDLAALKQRHGIPVELSSCHTALVGGYVLEGHIPARVVESFLEAAPEVKGITVPGMPIGSPGMEVDGVEPRPYDVIAFDGKGNRTVFRHIAPR